jgi:hypothetical protein
MPQDFGRKVGGFFISHQPDLISTTVGRQVCPCRDINYDDGENFQPKE